AAAVPNFRANVIAAFGLAQNLDARTALLPFRGDDFAEAVHGGLIEAGRFAADEFFEQAEHFGLAAAQNAQDFSGAHSGFRHGARMLSATPPSGNAHARLEPGLQNGRFQDPYQFVGALSAIVRAATVQEIASAPSSDFRFPFVSATPQNATLIPGGQAFV
ncbi:MAG TPA: hypothetical protein VJR26_05320, partial [Candidatus Acidoferrales bacterium]|nr:hypothetical protein [Candidatus Acidoferrales bacterium]